MECDVAMTAHPPNMLTLSQADNFAKGFQKSFATKHVPTCRVELRVKCRKWEFFRTFYTHNGTVLNKLSNISTYKWSFLFQLHYIQVEF